MALLSDSSWGLSNESTPGTYVAPSRWYEVMSPDFDARKNVKQGKGMRVGARVARSGRRVVTSADAGGSVGVEAVSKGLGLLLESMFGVGASTLVSGSTYQQLFTPATGTVLPSRTLQTGTVRADASGTVDAVSFLGSAVESWELEVPNDEIATIKAVWDCMNWTTAQSYVAPSYPTSPSLFHWSHVAVTLGGAVTVPTSTALASGGTAATNVRSVKFAGDNHLKKDRFNAGGSGRKSRQLIGDLDLSGELELEYVDTVVRDAFLNDTALALTVTLTGTEALSTGTATLQVTCPEIKLNGELPKGNEDDLPLLKVPFDILDGQVAGSAIYVALRTADTAL